MGRLRQSVASQGSGEAGENEAAREMAEKERELEMCVMMSSDPVSPMLELSSTMVITKSSKTCSKNHCPRIPS